MVGAKSIGSAAQRIDCSSVPGADRPARSARSFASREQLAELQRVHRLALGDQLADHCLIAPSVTVNVAPFQAGVTRWSTARTGRSGSTKNISSLRITEPLKSNTASRRHTGPISSAG